MISSSSPQFGKTLDFLRSWVGLRWVFRRVICDDLCSWNLSIYRYFHMSVCQSASCLWICSRTIQTNINNLKQTVFLFLSASLSAFLSVCLCVSSLFLSAFMTHRVSVQPSVVLSTCVPFISAYFTSAILRITPQTTSNAWVSASVCHLQLPECPKERRWAKGRAWADWGKRWARCRWLWTRLWSPWRRFYSLFARVAKVSVLAATGKHKIQFLLVIKADMQNVGKREVPVLRSRVNV